MGALSTIGLTAFVQPTMRSADAAIGKIDRMYTDLQAVLRVVCSTPNLLPPDVWPLVCASLATASQGSAL